MASFIPLSAVIFLLLCHGSMAQFFSPWQTSRHRAQSSQQCRFERLRALEPKRRVESDGGVTEYFDENNQQFECAGLAANRRTIHPKGLLLPFYSAAPSLVYILQGSGISGVVIPGCPETYQESSEQQGHGRQVHGQAEGEQRGREQQEGEQKGHQQQEGEQQAWGQREQEQQGQKQQSQQQHHQRIQRFRQGDIIAIPAGVAHWFYNDGDSRIISVTILDTSSSANQLNNDPREFSLAGRSSKESKRSANNVFRGFDVELLADSLGVNREIAQKLQQGQEGEIVRLERDLQVVKPWREEHQSQERRDQSGNGLDQAFCALRFRENIDNPSRADIYDPQAGRYTHLNGQKLTILNFIQMSAARGVLYRDALLAPHSNINTHSLFYVTRGRGRIQIVGDNGKSVFNDNLRQGRLVLVPQHYVAVIQAREERFEWVEFKTHGNAITNQFVGQGSFFRGLPEDVAANSYQGLSRGEARVLKSSVSLVAPRSRSLKQERADA